MEEYDLEKFQRQVLAKWTEGLEQEEIIIVKNHDLEIAQEIVGNQRWDDILNKIEEGSPTFFDVMVSEVTEAARIISTGAPNNCCANIISQRATDDMGVILALLFLPVYLANNYKWPTIGTGSQPLDYYKTRIEKAYKWRFGVLMKHFEEETVEALGKKYFRMIKDLIYNLKLHPILIEVVAKMALLFFHFVKVRADTELFMSR